MNRSPYRNPDGSLTAAAVAGKASFLKLGCDFCHSGAAQTDSAERQLHDVGTIGPNSGSRAGSPLLGIDTPTLLGVWETPPYLHDGSAPTLRDVLTTSNTTGLHGYVAALTSSQVDELVAYVQQIDDEIPAPTLPFEPARPAPVGGGGGQANGGQGGDGRGGGAQAGGPSSTSGSGGTPATPAAAPTASCACKLSSSPPERGALLGWAAGVASLVGAATRRRRRLGKGLKHLRGQDS